MVKCKQGVHFDYVSEAVLSDYPLDKLTCLDTTDVEIRGDSFFVNSYSALMIKFIPCTDDPISQKSSCSPEKDISQFLLTTQFKLWTSKNYVGTLNDD